MTTTRSRARRGGRQTQRKTARPTAAPERKAPAKTPPADDWHPSRPLPNEKHEAVVLLIFKASQTLPDCWANHTDAYCQVYPKSSRSAAASSVYELLKIPENLARLEWLKQEAARKALGTVEEADRILWELVSAKLNDYCIQLPDGTRVLTYDKESPNPHAMKKVKCRQTTGDDESEIRDLEFEIHDTRSALQLYYQRHGHLAPDKLTITEGIGDALAIIAKRKAERAGK